MKKILRLNEKCEFVFRKGRGNMFIKHFCVHKLMETDKMIKKISIKLKSSQFYLSI